MSNLYVGLDIGSDVHQALVMNVEHDSILETQVVQSIREIDRFIGSLLKLKKQRGCQEIIVGMESSSGYAAPLDRMLKHAGVTVIAINSVALNDYRKVVGQPRKDDVYDAQLVCEYLIDIYHLKGLRKNVQEIGGPDQASMGKLRVITRHYRTTKRELTRVTNRLRKHLLG